MQCFNIVFVIQQHLLIEEVLISNDFFLPLEISAVFIYVNIKFLVKSTNSHKQKKKKLNHTYIYIDELNVLHIHLTTPILEHISSTK